MRKRGQMRFLSLLLSTALLLSNVSFSAYAEPLQTTDQAVIEEMGETLAALATESFGYSIEEEMTSVAASEETDEVLSVSDISLTDRS